MSSEISTYLTGRYIQIPVFTLSYKEYLEFKKESDKSKTELLEEYIRFGGFPIIALGEYESRQAYQIVMEFIIRGLPRYCETPSDQQTGSI